MTRSAMLLVLLMLGGVIAISDGDTRPEKQQSEPGGSYIDITQFSPCTNAYTGNPGLMCGSKCRDNRYWCNDQYSDICDTNGGSISTQDPRLCGGNLLLNISCSSYNRDGAVAWYGKRCTGRNQQCIDPWYTHDDGMDGYSSETCQDKSDQIFVTSTFFDGFQPIICKTQAQNL